MSAETKVCPDCAEEIRAAARVCRYCGYRFEDQPSARAGLTDPPAESPLVVPDTDAFATGADATTQHGNGAASSTDDADAFATRLEEAQEQIAALYEAADEVYRQPKVKLSDRRRARILIGLEKDTLAAMTQQLAAPATNPPPSWAHGEIAGRLTECLTMIFLPLRSFVAARLEVALSPPPPEVSTPRYGEALGPDKLNEVGSWLSEVDRSLLQVEHAIQQYQAASDEESYVDLFAASAVRSRKWLTTATRAAHYPGEFVADPGDGGALRAFELELLVLDAGIDRAREVIMQTHYRAMLELQAAFRNSRYMRKMMKQAEKNERSS